MAVSLFKSSVTETTESRTVEMLFISGSDPEQTDEMLHFRIRVSTDGYPRTAEVQLKALQHVRDVINDGIQDLERIRGQAHPNEDWRG